jgi:hypothetical protein
VAKWEHTVGMRKSRSKTKISLCDADAVAVLVLVRSGTRVYE